MPKPNLAPHIAQRIADRKAQKVSASKRKPVSREPKQSIDPSKSYSRESLKQEVGLGFEWFREACKHGLKFAPVGRMKFVDGSDLIRFIKSGKAVALTSRTKKTKSK